MKPPRVSLADFVDSVQTGLDARRRNLHVSGDVLDVVARARSLAPEVVPRAWLDAAHALPPTPPSVAAVPAGGPLGQFLGEVAGALQSQLDAPRAPPAIARTRPRWVLPLLLAAAAVLLALGLSWSRRFVQSETPPRGHEAAEDLATEPDARELATPPTAPATLPATLPESVAPAPAPVAPPSGQRAARAKPAPQLGEPSLEALEREAQTLWAAGDLDGARDRFERIVARGGKSKIAELALGDLITIAMRGRDRTRLRAAWSRYVDRFPRGRYADDASAGLCRTNAAADRPACWRAYLGAFPQGVHRSEAREAAGGAGAP
ncbi:MAG: hypothetical protein K1X88_17325 [Nannocystaceae bacterium]|nr:hypothetical protein [Nannocystaceae bacterium]